MISEELLTMQNVGLEELWNRLEDLHARKRDIVVPARCLEMDGTGKMEVKYGQSTGLSVGADGSLNSGSYLMEISDDFRKQLSNRMGVPVKYQHRMMDNLPELYDINMNYWLKRERELDKPRNFLIRSYDNGDGTGHARAMLSYSYKIIDNLDILRMVAAAVMQHNKDGGQPIEVERCNLTHRSMHVSFKCPTLDNRAAEILRSYRNPETGIGNPGLSSGFILRNSETGYASTVIAPRVVIGACTNGMIWTQERFRKIHAGGNLQHGEIQWKRDTLLADSRAVLLKMRDAVSTFVSSDFLGQLVSDIEKAAKYQLMHPKAAVSNFCSDLGIGEDGTNEVLDYFIKQKSTATGFDVAQAVTFYAQKVDADTRFQLEQDVSSKMLQMHRYDKEPQLVTVQ